MPDIYEELSNIEETLGNKLGKIRRFFEENTEYTDEKLAKFLDVDLGVTERLLKEYADYELGLKIAEAVRTTGQCEFTAEL